ncbi:DEAD/DEAH box helicase [Mangrovibacterium marinum]|uniref:Superfamily II DNA/RNA helicase n=1 Tax=Mangrovibacterium marinum TaxID=1639118 RepID=A0A2T5BYH5_9BACT|nr:DEAD/DEAH box helicase [Mangrovibacterium marinum]PTN07293.1 superfamily II DNA/RNA helicase [Mangrovibacterium marinum]
MKFHEFDLHDDILDALYDMGFDEATVVQENTIPLILEGHDLIGCAQTGTGKTAAFMLPIIEKVAQKSAGATRALIIVPTRELAIQIEQQVQGFSYYAGTTSCAIYGGGDGKEWEEQRKALEDGVDIVVATPGKLISFIDNEIANLKQVEYVVLDEADRMLDIGFHDDIIRIFSHLPEQRQTLMFSATMPPKIRQLAAKVLKDPKEFASAISKPAEGVLQAAYVCHEAQKLPLIQQLITGKDDCQSIIVFSSTKRKVNLIVKALQKKNLDAQGISSDLEQKEREEVLMKFRARQTRIIVATDVLSRGIDIKDINLVVNFDVPGDAEDYVHRIGRTARANTTGIALTFVNEDDMYKFQQIEELIGSEVFKAPLPPELGEGPEWKVIQRKKKKKGNFKRNNRPKGNHRQPKK